MSSFLMTPSVSWCRFRWSERWSDLAKRRSQSSHLKGFSPVCLRMCRVSSSERAKLQLHSFQLHVYGFSPAKNEQQNTLQLNYLWWRSEITPNLLHLHCVIKFEDWRIGNDVTHLYVFECAPSNATISCRFSRNPDVYTCACDAVVFLKGDII